MKTLFVMRLSLPCLMALLTLPMIRGQTIYTPYHFVTIVGTPGATGSADGIGTAARFNRPQALSVDSSGNVYVADTNNDTIRKIVATVTNGVTTWTVSTLAGTPGVQGIVDGTGSAAQFYQPKGIYAAADGTVYVLENNDGGPNYIRAITPSGVVSSLLISTTAPTSPYGNNGGLSTNEGPAEDAYLATPTQAEAPNGDMFNIATEGGGIAADDLAVTESNVMGNLVLIGEGGGSQDGQSPNTSCYYPQGLAVDADNNVFVADTLNDEIRKGTLTVTNGTESWMVTTLGGVARNSGSSDGLAGAVRFNQPWGVAAALTGAIYVADAGNNTIRMGTADTGPVAVNTTANAVLGQPVTFSLAATDQFDDPITFAITGATGGSATLAGNQATFTPSAAGTGTVTFTASDGYVTSSPGTVTISTIPAQPVISQAAASQAVATGRSVAFNAQATGYPVPTYQWTLNGSTTIPGAAVTNDSILLISGATAADAGTYLCTATNLAGTATTTATLTIVTAGSPARLDNLSARAEDLSGGNILIAGLTVGGSGTEPVLLRAVGPGLVNVNVDSGLLPNPVLTVFDHNSVPIVSDAGWGNGFTAGSSTANISPSAATANLMIQVGAFPINAGSTDSAMAVQMAPGSYTLEATDANGATGVALAEVYDAGSGGGIRLTNISARADVGAGGDILIGGLTISGDSAETVLLRAVGPGLVNQNLPNNGLLAQPSLAVYQGSTQIYSNTGWGNDPVISSVFSLVGATVLESADSAVLITLPVGGYTVLVSGVGGASGIGLVEIYEVY